MEILNKSIAEIQLELASETDPNVFKELLVLEKQGKKRKVLKRWLKGMIKANAIPPSNFDPEFKMWEDDGFPTTGSNRVFASTRVPEDPITGIRIIG